MLSRHILPILAAVFLSVPAFGQETATSGCKSEGPVLDIQAADLVGVGDRWTAGPWRLPRFGDPNSVITDVRLQVVIRETPSAALPATWTVEIIGTYGDMHTGGFEYLTDAVQISLSGWFGPSLHLFDFSQSCQGQPLSLLPGMSWKASAKIPKGPDPLSPSNFRMTVWGRN